MKLLTKFWAILAGATVVLSSCADLDIFSEGEIFNSEQKENIAKQLPERLGADLAGMYSLMSTQFLVLPSSERADDFGHPSASLSSDLNASDMVSTNDSYNWFTTSSSFEDRTYTYSNPYIRWQLYYKQIKAANDMLKSIPSGTTDQALLFYKGQALAARAFAYLNLVYRYQFSYIGHENDPAVPLITDVALVDETTIPRASVQDVYEQIESDLDQAVILLNGFVSPDKGYINKQVAFGLRARMNLAMENWAAAAADADSALVGTTLLTLDQVSVPGFNSVTTGTSWMWALIINPDNIKDQYASWPSKLCSFAGNSYTANVGCYKMINNLLWNKIANSDVRKGWWVDENLKSPLIDSVRWPGFPDDEIGALTITDVKLAFLPYTNVKFNADNNEFGNGDNASDWCLMRAEEMVLIKAEGLAMSNRESEAKTWLEDYVKEYRNPSYSCTATTAQELQDEIWFQRRVELWGEGFAFWDIMRLRKDVVRFNSSVTSNFPSIFKFNISANDGWLLMRVPQRETSANLGIPESANNNGGVLPVSGQNPTLTDGVTD